MFHFILLQFPITFGVLLRVAGMAFAKAVFEVYVEDAVKQSLANVQEFVRVFLCTLVSRSNYAMEIAHSAILQACKRLRQFS